MLKLVNGDKFLLQIENSLGCISFKPVVTHQGGSGRATEGKFRTVTTNHAAVASVSGHVKTDRERIRKLCQLFPSTAAGETC